MSKKGGWHKRGKKAGVVGAEIARCSAESRRTRIAREVNRVIAGFENARCECAHKDRLFVDVFWHMHTVTHRGWRAHLETTEAPLILRFLSNPRSSRSCRMILTAHHRPSRPGLRGGHGDGSRIP